jgi:hypothetical protein
VNGIVGPDTRQALLPPKNNGAAAKGDAAVKDEPDGKDDTVTEGEEEEFVSTLWNYLTGKASAGGPPSSGTSPYVPPVTPAQPPASTPSRAQLAQQILDHKNIKLDTNSTTANGNPRQNIVDTANGLPATSGCFDFNNCGSMVELSTKMLQALLTLANNGNSFHVTSFAGGRHGSKSDHYKGRAVDIGIWNNTNLGSPNSAHTAARDALIAAGASSDQTFNAYHDPTGGHKNHVHAAFY